MECSSDGSLSATHAFRPGVRVSSRWGKFRLTLPIRELGFGNVNQQPIGRVPLMGTFRQRNAAREKLGA